MLNDNGDTLVDGLYSSNLFFGSQMNYAGLRVVGEAGCCCDKTNPPPRKPEKR